MEEERAVETTDVDRSPSSPEGDARRDAEPRSTPAFLWGADGNIRRLA